MKKKTLLVCLVVVSGIYISCSKSDNPGPNPNPPPQQTNCGTTPKSFATDVNPIIQSFCNQAGCHTNGSTNGPGPLTNYTQVFNARSVVRNAVATGLMPKNATLTASQKAAILCWVDAGAPNN